jgi:ribosome maturation factor RimP
LLVRGRGQDEYARAGTNTRTNTTRTSAAGRSRGATHAVAPRGSASPSAVRELIERTIRGLGYELVEVERAAGGLLRVTLDTPDAPGQIARRIGLDDCEQVSRQLTHLFAVEQVDYERLEVCSPGLDRLLTGARDFVRFAGSPVKLQLKVGLHGRRRFQGQLLGLGGQAGAEQVRLALSASGASAAGSGRGRDGQAPRSQNTGALIEQPQTIELPLADIEKARLVPQFDFKANPANGTSDADKGARRVRQEGSGEAPSGNEEGPQ